MLLQAVITIEGTLALSADVDNVGGLAVMLKMVVKTFLTCKFLAAFTTLQNLLGFDVRTCNMSIKISLRWESVAAIVESTLVVVGTRGGQPVCDGMLSQTSWCSGNVRTRGDRTTQGGWKM